MHVLNLNDETLVKRMWASLKKQYLPQFMHLGTQHIGSIVSGAKEVDIRQRRTTDTRSCPYAEMSEATL